MCWSPWAGRHWTPAWTSAHPCGSRNRLCDTNGRLDPAGASPGPLISWRRGSGPGRRAGCEATKWLEGVFLMKRRVVANLFYLLLAAFTRAAVWFGVFHCEFIQGFFSFGTSLRVTLSCLDEKCTEATNMLAAVSQWYILQKKCRGPDLLLQLIHHFRWPSLLSPGRPSGGPRSHRCRWWTELLLAARSRRSGASVGPCRQTWGTAGERKAKGTMQWKITKKIEKRKKDVTQTYYCKMWKISFCYWADRLWRTIFVHQYWALVLCSTVNYIARLIILLYARPY